MVIYEMKSVINSLHLVAVSRIGVVLSTILKKAVQNEQ